MPKFITRLCDSGDILKSIVICGGHPLEGVVKISGSKNAALPCLSASLIANESVTLENIPAIGDVKCMIDVLRLIGCKVNVTKDRVTVDAGCPDFVIPSNLSKLMRGSTLLLSSLLSRCGRVRIEKYGGCPIGSRFIDIHLDVFKCLGATIKRKGSFTEICSDNLIGTEICLPFPSVGATENAVVTACVAKGRTVLRNVAIEPEVINLIQMLQLMGAEITVNFVEKTIEIVGTKDLGGATHKIISDRIEAGTYALVAGLIGRNVVLQDLDVNSLCSVFTKITEMGVDVKLKDKNSVEICSPDNWLKNVKITTSPYPDFPTDMQSPFTTLCTQASGKSYIFESLYENRFHHVPELKKMGANLNVSGRKITIIGPTPLCGQTVKAVDLRGGAALVIAGLIADGVTTVDGAEIIERGYEYLDRKLSNIGAKIEVVKND